MDYQMTPELSIVLHQLNSSGFTVSKTLPLHFLRDLSLLKEEELEKILKFPNRLRVTMSPLLIDLREPRRTCRTEQVPQLSVPKKLQGLLQAYGQRDR